MSETKEITFGQRAVDDTIDPDSVELVDQIKTNYAALIDHLNLCREKANSSERKRMYSVAITEAQTSAKWAIDAAGCIY